MVLTLFKEKAEIDSSGLLQQTSITNETGLRPVSTAKIFVVPEKAEILKTSINASVISSDNALQIDATAKISDKNYTDESIIPSKRIIEKKM
jgi:hypothetical protein